MKGNFTWCCTTMYRPNERNLKHVFWDELKSCRGAPDLPWIICNDFNAIFSAEDKLGGPRNLVDIRNANDFLQDLNFLEPPTIGRWFTWTNG